MIIATFWIAASLAVVAFNYCASEVSCNGQ